jgi:hypoxanthine phosphoribosyltransferase
VVVAVSDEGVRLLHLGWEDVQRLAEKVAEKVKTSGYTGVEQRRGTPEIVYPLNADVPDLKVLVVDDVSDSGNSLKAAREHVLERGASEARVATLHVKPWSNFRPHYYAEEVEAWVVYPWEPMETLMWMEERLKNEGLNPDEVRQRLLEKGFDPELVEKLP